MLSAERLALAAVFGFLTGFYIGLMQVCVYARACVCVCVA